jgi:hypothetical protein
MDRANNADIVPQGFFTPPWGRGVWNQLEIHVVLVTMAHAARNK